MAREGHFDQARKGSGTPFLAHLLTVSALVLEHGGDEDEAIAALLHDLAEDQGGLEALGRIRAEFGDRVAEIVAANSDTFDAEKPDWLVRKQGYVAAIGHKSRSARLVSMADKLHNASSMVQGYEEVGESYWGVFRGTKEQIGWYYRALLHAFEASAPDPGDARASGYLSLLGKLRRAVVDLEEVLGS